MAGTLLPFPQQAYLDANGNPYSSGKLYIFASGTTTPLTVYSDIDLSVAHAHPIVLNSSGRVPNGIYTAAVTVKVRLDDASDVTIFTQDNVPSTAIDVSNNVNASGYLSFVDATELTISSGAITVTQNYHKVDTESDASTDALATITAGTDVVAGHVLCLRVESAARSVVLHDADGNLDIGADITLDETHTTYSLIYDGTNWRPWTYQKPAPPAPSLNEFRLSLTSGTAVTTADVTGAGTVYMALYKGNKISLYTGSEWTTVASAQLSIALSGGSASKPHDIFLDYNDGSPALTLLVWTNATTRATALAAQDGVLCKTGDLQQRYLGTVYSDGSKQCADSYAKRHCWNYYNRQQRPMRVIEATNSWTYTTATWRQANDTATNQLDFVVGVSEDLVEGLVISNASNSSGGQEKSVAVGLDSTSAPATSSLHGRMTSGGGNDEVSGVASYRDLPGIGKHILVWLEYSAASGTTTWYGDNGGNTLQSGINGTIKG